MVTIRPAACSYYYLGYFAEKLGQTAKASDYYRQAMAMPPDYAFPFQREEIGVLRAAMRANPRDARAPYYMGNLLYDWQPQEATRMWEPSAALDPSFAITHRNLAVAYMHLESGADLPRAIAELEKAVSQDRKYPLHFTELDDLYGTRSRCPEGASQRRRRSAGGTSESSARLSCDPPGGFC